MGRRGPLITLAAVGALAAIVLGVSLVRTPIPGQAAPAAPPPPLAIADTQPPPTSAVPTREAVYVGHSSGNEVTVAVAVSGDQASAYICDGERSDSCQSDQWTTRPHVPPPDKSQHIASRSRCTLLSTTCRPSVPRTRKQ